MRREYGFHDSAALQTRMEYLVYGHGGAPVLVFPTSRGRFFQWEDFSMVHAIRRFLDNGWIQLFCVDSVDAQSWYNFECEPVEQMRRHLQYDRYLAEEFVPWLRTVNSVPYLMTTGTSFGAYHAVNFSFRHPDLVQRVIAMSGDFCIRKYLDEHYDLDVYYNNPVDYLPPTTDPRRLAALRRMDIILATAQWDFCLGPTERLSQVLTQLGVGHQYAVWGEQLTHDWPTWKRMIVRYL